MSNWVPVRTWINTETGQKCEVTPPNSENQPYFEPCKWCGKVGCPKGNSCQGWPHERNSFYPELEIKRLHEDAILPTRGNPDDAGLDIYSIENITLLPIYKKAWRDAQSPSEYLIQEHVDAHRVKIKTGIAVQVPPGFAWLIWDRSGVSIKHGIHRVAGVLDASYRGEIKIGLVNLGHQPYEIKKGDRIAQAILTPIALPRLKEVDELSSTKRGADGLGSTGK